MFCALQTLNSALTQMRERSIHVFPIQMVEFASTTQRNIQTASTAHILTHRTLISTAQYMGQVQSKKLNIDWTVTRATSVYIHSAFEYEFERNTILL